MSRGIVLLQSDAVVRSKARKLGLDVTVAADWPQPYTHTLYIGPGTRTPWDLVQTGFSIIERWDAAAPLWTYGVLAAALGTPEERRKTEKGIRDLRVPVYAPDLLFVAATEAGKALVSTWRAECAGGDEALADERLAFLRALYRVKPRFCALPRTWLADVQQRSTSSATGRGTPRRQHPRGSPLIRVEVTPGRFVRCKREDAEKVKELYKSRQGRRRG